MNDLHVVGVNASKSVTSVYFPGEFLNIIYFDTLSVTKQLQRQWESNIKHR